MSEKSAEQVLADSEYKYGFVTDVEADTIPMGLNEDIIRMLSEKKGEPEWMLEWRLKAYRRWLKMKEPRWANLDFPPIDFQALRYYSAPKKRAEAEIDPELQKTFERLGIPLHERNRLEGVAVDAVFDSVSVATTHKEMLKGTGVIFCSFSEAIREHPDLVKKYMGTVVPYTDNFYAALNAAVVELIAMDNAQIKYATVQNWYAGDKEGKGGIYNFVTKRGHCRGRHSKISWTQVEAGSAITWKYPGCVLEGDHSVGEFYSVALTNNKMQADTGTKMIHIGNHTRSTIVSKGISAGESNNTYRSLLQILPDAKHCRNHTQCDSMLIGPLCKANTFPNIEAENGSAVLEHEATTSRISEEQLFYLKCRGIKEEDAVSLVVNGFCKEVLKQLPLEFAVEAIKLLEMKLDKSVG